MKLVKLSLVVFICILALVLGIVFLLHSDLSRHATIPVSVAISTSSTEASSSETSSSDQHAIDPVTATYGNATFQITGTTTGYADDQTESYLLTVYQAGKVVIKQSSENDQSEMYILGKGCPWVDGPCDPNSSPTFGEDITSNGGHDFIVNELSQSGDSSLDNYYIFELPKDGRVIRRIATLSVDGGAAFKKLPSGKFDVELKDDTFRFWNTDDVHSPWPSIILTYQNGQFAPDLILMRKPVPATATLKQEANQWTSDSWVNGTCSTEDTCSVPWGYALDLIYSGNASAAKKYIDMAWKPNKAFLTEQDFTNKLSDQLKQSPYYSSILALNGGNIF